VAAGLVLMTIAALAPTLASGQATTQWRTTATAAEEVPPTNSSSTGTFSATLDESAGTLTWSLVVPNINAATAAHIHSGARGVNGPIVVNLFAAPAGAPASSINTSGTARAADVVGPLANNFAGLVSALKAGTLYVNVHTSANAGGEIRGQIVASQATATATPTGTAAATATATPKATATAVATATTVPEMAKSGSGGYLDAAGRDNRLVLALLAAVSLAAIVASRGLARR
jgi:hypothetical protein